MPGPPTGNNQHRTIVISLGESGVQDQCNDVQYPRSTMYTEYNIHGLRRGVGIEIVERTSRDQGKEEWGNRTHY